ncbi:TetR/AcrR family transcriptional regulator [Streptomyces sp. GESEQ-35]|uniref:TetR/AcrR family transcriptional regulator n=1 Tax=Streptomyces sp. GESEQ-35 TaxID=2812657 RepID=UPI001B32C228|nr:TetR family transcriptional regulator [Streptomyces sp. GESEQ-35]
MQKVTDGRLARGEARRELLLDAAVGIVGEQGLGALTHRAVAASAAVSLASVTYHYPSADDLRQATFEHAGSRIGLEFLELVTRAAEEPDALPDICGDFTARLVTQRRIDTIAVFEMILAAGHDSELEPVKRLLELRLARLLAPYVGSDEAAFTVTAALQGLVLTALSPDRARDPGRLRDAVSDLIRRYRAIPAPGGPVPPHVAAPTAGEALWNRSSPR